MRIMQVKIDEKADELQPHEPLDLVGRRRRARVSADPSGFNGGEIHLAQRRDDDTKSPNR